MNYDILEVSVKTTPRDYHYWLGFLGRLNEVWWDRTKQLEIIVAYLREFPATYSDVYKAARIL